MAGMTIHWRLGTLILFVALGIGLLGVPGEVGALSRSRGFSGW